MAKTYDDYETNKAASTPGGANRWMSIEDRMDIAMNQTELLIGVRRRVQEFLDSYEKFMEFEIRHVAEVRENSEATDRARSIADNMELDIQTLSVAPNSPKNARLLLDDIKVLLDQLPQKDI